MNHDGSAQREAVVRPDPHICPRPKGQLFDWAEDGHLADQEMIQAMDRAAGRTAA